MNKPSPDIAALVGSRICHDLISPVGAIGNGIELMTLASGAQGPELGLITDSVGNASARIRFFRIAFGHAGMGQKMPRGEVLSVLGDLQRAGRLRYDFTVMGDLSRDELRAVFLAILCLESDMPYGGTIAIARDGVHWCIAGQSERMNRDADLWEQLGKSHRPLDISPAHVQFALLPDVVQDLGRALSLRQSPAQVEIRF